MMKFMKRLVYLILGCLFLFGLSQGRLTDIPLFRYCIWGAWILCAGVLICFLGKRRGWWVILMTLGLLCFANTSQASWFDDIFGGGASLQVSSYYKTYCQKIEQAEKNNWRGEEPCDEKYWNRAREIVSQTTETAPDDTDGCNCSSEYNCAVKLMGLCSQYEQHHPKKDVHTVMEILANQDSGCWPCDMATIIFVVIQNLSFMLYNMMTEVAVVFLGLIFLGWISFAGLSAVVFPSEGMTFPTRALKNLLAVMLTLLVLKTEGMTTLYNGVLNPVMSLGMGVAQEITESATGIATRPSFNSLLRATFGRAGSTEYCATASAFNPILDTSETVIPGGINFSNRPIGNGPDIVLQNIGLTQEENLFSNISQTLLGNNWMNRLLPSSGKNNSLLNDSMKAKLLCMTQKFYQQSNPFVAVGQSLIEFSTKDAEPIKVMGFRPFGDLRIPDPFIMALVGIAFVAFFTIFSFLIAFKVMDIFLRLAFFLVLMPLFVAAIAFPVTRDFTKKGWDFLLHTILEFLGLALAIAFIMQMMESFLAIDHTALLSAMTAGYSDNYGENLLKAVYRGGGCRFLFGMIAVCFLGFQVLKKMTPMIDSIFGVKGVANESLIAGTIMSNVSKGYGVLTKAAEVAGHEKIQYKTPDAEKREEIKQLSKDLKKEQKQADKLQYDATTKDAIAKSLEKTAASKTATEADKKRAQQARREAQAAQALADAQKRKVEELKNKILVAEGEASALRFPSSQSKFKARRYVDDFMSEAHYGMQRDAEKIEKFGLNVGRVLNKTGIGAVVGVPLILGTKATSMAWRIPTKVASMAVHGTTALAAGGAHSYQWVKKKLTGK